MRVDNQLAYVLHHYPFRDSSQILEVITRDHGRISIMSRGSLGARSKLKSVLQLFRLLNISWIGKGDMPTLTSAELVANTPQLLNGKNFASGFYLNELLLHFLHRHDVQETIFKLYMETISALAAETDAVEIVLRLFEKQLLDELGLGLNLTHDADSGSSLDEFMHYVFRVEHGPILSSAAGATTSLPIVSGKSLQALARHDLSDVDVRREIKILMRYILAHYLAGKPLKSRELFR